MGSYTAVPITNEVRLRRRLDVWEGRAGAGAPVIPDRPLKPQHQSEFGNWDPNKAGIP